MKKEKSNIVFEGIGFNKDSLSKMDRAALGKEVEHHFPGQDGKVDELYKILHNGDNKKSAGQLAEAPAK